MTDIDVTSRLEKRQARKLLSLLLLSRPNFVSFTKHCRHEMKNDHLTSVDVLNVLKAGSIFFDAEFEHEAWRYRVETTNILVVIQFRSACEIVCITAWRK